MPQPFSHPAGALHARFTRLTRRALSLLLCLLILPACSSLAPPPAPTQTPEPSPTATATILWFPPTATRTPAPSPIPVVTQDYLVGVGDQLFTDDFSQTALWSNAYTPGAAVFLEDKRLTISVDSETNSTLLATLRSEPVLEDFYYEVTASLNLCKGGDRYGLIFRASGIANYYRYVLNCDGQTRFERVVDGVPSAPREWLASAGAPPGAPGQVRVGVWAAGAELRFFLDGRYQYTIDDSTFRGGTVGLFVSSSSSTPASVGFSDLIVQAVRYRRPTPTPYPTATP